MSYKPGDYYVICDICGFQQYASECRLNWKKQLACPACYEEKHPQYTDPKPLHEKQKVPIHRPEGDPVFIDVSIRPESVTL